MSSKLDPAGECVESTLMGLRVRGSRFGAPMLCLVALCVGLMVGQPFVHAAALPVGFSESLVASGLSRPTAMAFAPDGRLFVAQQGGQLRVVKEGVLLPDPFLTVTVNSSGERGLLGIAFDPDFGRNQFVYVYYTATTPFIHNRVSRFTASGDVAAPNSEAFILDLDPLSGAENHNGGAMHFGRDGKIYIATGENANRDNAQSLNNLLGKILRINPDGTIPEDNPFYEAATGNYRAIWAIGLRNPFTFALQPGTDRMFINDVGEGTWEEINDGLPGANFGWPICEGDCVPSRPDLRNPIHRYANDASTCAITGGAFYNPMTPQFPAEFVGDYFFSDFCGGWIKRFDPLSGQVADFATGIANPVDLKVAQDGSLYYLARGNGSVFQVRTAGPGGSTLTPTPTQTPTISPSPTFESAPPTPSVTPTQPRGPKGTPLATTQATLTSQATLTATSASQSTSTATRTPTASMTPGSGTATSPTPTFFKRPRT
jgi:glucose/arabinose dehydrogenase